MRLGLVCCGAFVRCGSSNGGVGVAANCGVLANDSPISGACALVRRVLPVAGVAALGGSEKSRLLRGSVGVALCGLPVVGVALPGSIAPVAAVPAALR